MTTGSGKHLGDISQAHIVSLLYRSLTSRRGSDDLFNGFDHSPNRRRDDLAQNKHIKKNSSYIYAERRIRFLRTSKKSHLRALTRKKVDAIIDKATGITVARLTIDHIPWYLPHYTPSIQRHSIIFNQFLSKTPTELRYVQRSDFMKEVNNQNLRNFEQGSQELLNVPIWKIISFQQRGREDLQNLNNEPFCIFPVTSCRWIIVPKSIRMQDFY